MGRPRGHAGTRKIRQTRWIEFHWDWLSGMSYKIMANKYGVSNSPISKMSELLGLPPRHSTKPPRVREYILMVDPPQGYLYGFPKAYEGEDPDLKEWLISMGYPEHEMILSPEGQPQYIRMWLVKNDGTK